MEVKQGRRRGEGIGVVVKIVSGSREGKERWRQEAEM